MTQFLRSPSQRSTFLMLLSLFFFATSVLLLRGLALEVPGAIGWIGILFRGWVGLILLVSIFGGTRGLVLRHCFTNPKLAARGIVGAIATLLFYISIVHLGAGRAIVINLTYPLFGVIIAAIWLRETLTLRAGLWLFAGFAGLLVFFSDGAFAGGLGVYDLVALVGAATSGVAVVFIRGLSKHHHASTIYASQCLYGILLTLPVIGSQVLTLPGFAWGILILSGCLVAVGQLSITAGFRHLSVARGSSIQMLLPLLTAGGAYFVFGEILTPFEIAGALITLLATWQVLRSPAPTAPTGPAPAPAGSSPFPSGQGRPLPPLQSSHLDT